MTQPERLRPSLRLVKGGPDDGCGAIRVHVPAAMAGGDENFEHCRSILSALGVRIEWHPTNPARLLTIGLGERARQRIRGTERPKRTVFLGAEPLPWASLAAEPGRRIASLLPETGALVTYLHAAHANQSAFGHETDILVACPIATGARASSGDTFRDWPASLNHLEAIAARHYRKRTAFLLERADKNALVQSLVYNRSGIGTDDAQPDFVELERGIAALLADPHKWDMIVCRPEHRVLVETVIGHGAGLKPPHAMQFAGDGIQAFGCSPELDDPGKDAALRLPAYLHAIIAMLVSLGARNAARQIYTALVIALDRGMMVEGMPSKSPYAKLLAPDEFSDAIIGFLDGTARRPIRDSAFGIAAPSEPAPQRFEPRLIG